MEKVNYEIERSKGIKQQKFEQIGYKSNVA